MLFLVFPVQAEIFQWFDAEGKQHYSDKPHQGAKEIKIDTGYSYYRVKAVYDGDTVLLENGKKIRLLGINTPEVEGRNKAAQAGGEEAKQWLSAELKNKKVRLEKDIEKKDKYGRLLAHIFTVDKKHINYQLVKNGLASVNIYPPNLKYVNKLLGAEKQAEQKQLGIWGNDAYSPKLVADIGVVRINGWQRVLGEIKNIRNTRKNCYLNFSDTFAIKINRKALVLFPKMEDYLGKELEVRGWISRRKKKYSLFIRHPSAIKIIEKITVRPSPLKNGE